MVYFYVITKITNKYTAIYNCVLFIKLTPVGQRTSFEIYTRKMAPVFVILFIFPLVIGNPVTNKIEELVTSTYNKVLNEEVEKGIGSTKLIQLPHKMKEFIEKIGEQQLPLVHSQIKEEAKLYSNDLKQFIEKEVKNYIEPLRIKEFVSSHLKRHRRDDEEMPNYLDHFYGGLGK